MDSSGKGRDLPSPFSSPWLRGFLFAVATFFLGIWAYPLIFRPGDSRPPREPLLNKPAITFHLERLDEPGELSLSQFEGKIVLLNFWASWCDACRDEARDLVQLARESLGDYVVVGIGIQDTRENLEEFARKYGLGFPLGRDPEGDTAIAYGVTGIPETFMIDRKGVIRYRWRGPIVYTQVKKILEEILKDS